MPEDEKKEKSKMETEEELKAKLETAYNQLEQLTENANKQIEDLNNKLEMAYNQVNIYRNALIQLAKEINN